MAAISGSLREKSFNTASLRELQALADADITISIYTLHDVEAFNEDVEAKGWPPNVKLLRDELEAADGIIVATPEYNYSIPGVLKNALDWLSRPTGEGPIVGKPVTIIGASQSKTATARAQAHLRQVFFYNAMPLLPDAEVLIGNAEKKFDDEGRLSDTDTRQFLAKMLPKFADWVRQHR